MNKKMVTNLSYEVAGCAIEVHRQLGPGLLERVYEVCMVHELRKRGFKVAQQVEVPVYYDNLILSTNLQIDMLVNDLIVVELKAVETMHPVYQAQLLTYMKLLEAPQGLLINFFTTNITKSMIPMVNEYFNGLPD